MACGRKNLLRGGTMARRFTTGAGRPEGNSFAGFALTFLFHEWNPANSHSAFPKPTNVCVPMRDNSLHIRHAESATTTAGRNPTRQCFAELKSVCPTSWKTQDARLRAYRKKTDQPLRRPNRPARRVPKATTRPLYGVSSRGDAVSVSFAPNPLITGVRGTQ